jgi:hypothetical protein
MKYAQIKSGNKLHLVFEAEGLVSAPICGIKTNGYRMTINAPLGHSCRNCQKVMGANGGVKTKKEFYSSLIK